MARGAVCLLLLAASWHRGFAQDGGARTPKTLVFDVASVRENVSGAGGGGYLVRPGALSVTNYQLQFLIARAYGISLSLWPQFMIGGDAAILAKRFDIQAIAGREADADELSIMLRSLLAERFKLRLRRETRPLPVYEAIVLRAGRLGPELRPSPYDCRAMNETLRAKGEWSLEALATLKNSQGGLACRDDGPRPPPGAVRNKNSGKLAQLFRNAEGYAGRRIIDATGLVGTFEWKVEFTPVTGRILDIPSIFTAFEEQLGLRLRPSTAEMDVLVIESVEMPEPN